MLLVITIIEVIFLSSYAGISENVVSANLKLPEIAREVGNDWPALAHELNISNQDIERLQDDGEDTDRQGLSMLQLWLKQAGIMATGVLLNCCVHLSHDVFHRSLSGVCDLIA